MGESTFLWEKAAAEHKISPPVWAALMPRIKMKNLPFGLLFATLASSLSFSRSSPLCNSSRPVLCCSHLLLAITAYDSSSSRVMRFLFLPSQYNTIKVNGRGTSLSYRQPPRRIFRQPSFVKYIPRFPSTSTSSKRRADDESDDDDRDLRMKHTPLAYENQQKRWCLVRETSIEDIWTCVREVKQAQRLQQLAETVAGPRWSSTVGAETLVPVCVVVSQNYAHE